MEPQDLKTPRGGNVKQSYGTEHHDENSPDLSGGKIMNQESGEPMTNNLSSGEKKTENAGDFSEPGAGKKAGRETDRHAAEKDTGNRKDDDALPGKTEAGKEASGEEETSAVPEGSPAEKKDEGSASVPEAKKAKKPVGEDEKAGEGDAPAASGEKDEDEIKGERETKKTPSGKKKEKAGISPPKKEKPEYYKYNQVELVNAMRDLLDHDGDHNIKEEMEAIRSAFYRRLKEDQEEEKKHFIEQGGSEEAFTPEENPYEQDIKDLLKRYRYIKIEYNKKQEEEKERNLQLKYQVIEEIKNLIHKEESINKTFQDFRDLQQQWREIGLVPQSKMKNLYDTYHFHVENFYDYIKINKELRDLDLKKNLEMKIRLCEQAEELLFEPNIIRAFNALQRLHGRWREIGPVPREKKDEIWERFKASTAKINKKHQDYFDKRKTEQKENLEAKRTLCEKVEEISGQELSTHKDWNEASKEVINLQKVWRTIGFAPRKDNNKIYDRFRTACDHFFDAKRDFYARNKELQQNNLQLKIDLCVQAESLKDSTDWRKTTQDFINIQKHWKEIGPVPRKQSDVVWKRFREACDYFFEKKSEHFSSIDSEQLENLRMKEELINAVKSFKSKGDVDENLKILKDFQRRWTEIGHVPIKKKDEVQRQFREAINELFDHLNLDESKRNLLKFRTKIASFSESFRGQKKMYLERDKYVTRLKQLENDLVLLDNNVGFFAKSKNAESLIRDVNRQIEQTKEKIEFLKDKIRVIDEMDPAED